MHRAYQAVAPAPEPDPYDSRLMVDFSAPFQNNWLGLSGDYALIAGQASYGLSPAQITAEWDRVARSGVKTVSTWCDQSWSMPTYPAGSPNWTSSDMTGFWAGVQAMKDRGINVAIRAGWHFPQNVGALSGAAPITPTVPQEAIYASWVSELLNQAINVRGFTNVTICQFFTEPTTSMGTIPGGYPQPWDYYAHIATVARDKIVTDDAGRTPIRPRITLLGPGEFSYTADPWLEGVKAAAPAVLDAYAGHSYFDQPIFAPFAWGAINAADYATWIALFTDWVADASPKPLYVDESGFLLFATGGPADTLGYYNTADAGWQWLRQVDGHMQAGAAASWIWLLADQPILGAVLKNGTYRWKVDSDAAKPSWQAMSLHANLTGGGPGTRVSRAVNGTSTLHGTGVFIPFGVKNAVNPAGEWTVVIINEGAATDVRVALAGLNLTGRTVYRYVYSGEQVPVPATDQAYLKPWDQRITGVETEFPTTRCPAKSVVFLTTMNIAAPTSENLALTATVTATSTGFGDPRNVAKNNPTNVIGARNSWRKATDASQSLTLTWPAAVSLSRLELAFVGTTTGVVYATGVDTTSPAPLADYTIEYFNGSTWVLLVSVTGNALPNRTHAFAPVSTTAIRLNATSAAATAQVNNVGVYAS